LAIAALELARPGQRLAQAAAGGAAACHGHLLADRVHEQRAGLHVHRAEIGIGLAADGIERQRPLRGPEDRQRSNHRIEIAARRGARGELGRFPPRAAKATKSEGISAREIDWRVIRIISSAAVFRYGGIPRSIGG
jgi:hypothetical protein